MSAMASASNIVIGTHKVDVAWSHFACSYVRVGHAYFFFFVCRYVTRGRDDRYSTEQLEYKDRSAVTWMKFEPEVLGTQALTSSDPIHSVRMHSILLRPGTFESPTTLIRLVDLPKMGSQSTLRPGHIELYPSFLLGMAGNNDLENTHHSERVVLWHW